MAKAQAEATGVDIDAVKRFASGEPAIGITDPHIAHAELRSFEGIVPKTTNWRMLGASEKELAMYPDEGSSVTRAQTPSIA